MDSDRFMTAKNECMVIPEVYYFKGRCTTSPVAADRSAAKNNFLEF